MQRRPSIIGVMPALPILQACLSGVSAGHGEIKPQPDQQQAVGVEAEVKPLLEATAAVAVKSEITNGAEGL